MSEGSGSHRLGDLDFEIVLVTYRSRRHVVDLLSGWPADQPVVVVDNSANVDGIRELVAQYPSCRLLDGGGQGFARAANKGAFSSKHAYVVFVNPDSRPRVADLEALVRCLVDQPLAASCAATMTAADGSTEIGVGGWEPSIGRAFVHGLGLHKVLPNAGIFARPAPGVQCNPDWTSGACMAVSTARFRSLGGFDEMFYVYAEDIAYGRKARQAGYRPILEPSITVPHGAGASGAPSTEMLRLRGASFSYYLKSYHSRPRALGVLGATTAGYALRAAVAYPRQRERAQSYLAFIAGMMTGRAQVGGTEVARARYLEVTRQDHAGGSPAQLDSPRSG